jgi:hypothetical protein
VFLVVWNLDKDAILFVFMEVVFMKAGHSCCDLTYRFTALEAINCECISVLKLVIRPKKKSKKVRKMLRLSDFAKVKL